MAQQTTPQTIIPGLAGAPPVGGVLTQLLDSLAPEDVDQLAQLAEAHFAEAGDGAADEPLEGEEGEVEEPVEEELTAEQEKEREEADAAAAQTAADTSATEARSMLEEMNGFRDQANDLREEAEELNDSDGEEGEVSKRTVDMDAFDEKLALFDAMIEEVEELADDCESFASKEKFDECAEAYAQVGPKHQAAEQLLGELTEAVRGEGSDVVAPEDQATPDSPLSAWMKTYKG